MTDRTCSFDGCDKPHESRGYCASHAKQLRKGKLLHPLRAPKYDGAECAIDGCGEPAVARGWCSKHWQRWNEHGDPLAGGSFRSRVPRSATPEERFWSKVNKNGLVREYAPHLGPCWLWDAGCFPSGYGQFQKADGSKGVAHKIAYEMERERVPDGLELDHLCHTLDESCPGGKTCPHRKCVNPDHLEPVPGIENIRRGRAPEAQTRRAAAMTTCESGRHVWIPENIYVASNGAKSCRPCVLERSRNRQRRSDRPAVLA